jgi:hypothetical protein
MKGKRMAKEMSNYKKNKEAAIATARADLLVYQAKHATGKKKKQELLQAAGRNEETSLLLLAEVAASKNKKCYRGYATLTSYGFRVLEETAIRGQFKCLKSGKVHSSSEFKVLEEIDATEVRKLCC